MSARGVARHAPPLVPVPGARPGSLPAFHMGRTPVTNAEFAPFLATGAAPEPPWWRNPDFCAPDQPVVGVNWYDAVAYVEWLSLLDGGLWRLPTSAEWEWSARGGLPDAPTAWGQDLPPGEVPAGPLAGPWRVGRGRPNAYGLLDIGTVVHEWCADAVADARSPNGERRVSCGGSWRHRVRWSPPSARSSLPPAFRYADYGFRVLREGR
jgi:formylglycine-generating enzyme required for sulfatase activity